LFIFGQGVPLSHAQREAKMQIKSWKILSIVFLGGGWRGVSSYSVSFALFKIKNGMAKEAVV
jgi:hypothetical protein